MFRRCPQQKITTLIAVQKTNTAPRSITLRQTSTHYGKSLKSQRNTQPHSVDHRTITPVRPLVHSLDDDTHTQYEKPNLRCSRRIRRLQEQRTQRSHAEKFSDVEQPQHKTYHKHTTPGINLAHMLRTRHHGNPSTKKKLWLSCLFFHFPRSSSLTHLLLHTSSILLCLLEHTLVQIHDELATSKK